MGQTVCFNCRRSLEPEDELRALTRACESCLQALLSSRDTKLSACLESFNVPAALMSHDHTILGANGLFKKIAVNQDSVGLRIGKALGCMYAPLLGRCGDIVACLLCSLKRSVEQTWLRGEGLRGVSLSFPHKAESRKTFALSTEKVGDAVLVVLAAGSTTA